jgi:hypothetical protein
LVHGIPDPFADLLEIAAYVYCADQAIPRGGQGVLNFGMKWRRKLQFAIPVRVPELWRSAEMMKALTECLDFVSDDSIEFHFAKLRKAQPVEQYFEFGDGQPVKGIEEVILFSGGLDSLGGAVKESILDGRKVALVSHRSTPKVVAWQTELLNRLNSRASRKARPYFVPVRVNKHFDSADMNQRCRSFLYASLAGTVAHRLGLRRIRFYENGIVSFNLPPSGQSIGARASRTTHPKTLDGFQKILSIVADRDFTIESPYIWKTKADVLEDIKAASLTELLKISRSCSHVRESTKQHTHCGTCSQCIDRRLASVSAGLAEEDPAEMYAKNIFVDSIDSTEDRTMAESFVSQMRDFMKGTEEGFFGSHGEIYSGLEYLKGEIEENAHNAYELHQRNAKQRQKAFKWAFRKYGDQITSGDLPANSVLRMVLGDRQLPPSGDENFRPGPDFRTIFWNGQDYTLTSTQADIVRILYECYLNKTPGVGEQHLLTATGSNATRLRDIFRTRDDIWGKLIIPSAKGIFRLNLP